MADEKNEVKEPGAMVPSEGGPQAGTLKTQDEAGQIMDIRTFKANLKKMKTITETYLQKGVDYGGVFKGDKKVTLLKPGAEKLLDLFRYVGTYELEEKTVDYQGGFFAFEYKCFIYPMGHQGDPKAKLAEGQGESNSHEPKYRYRWLWDNEVTEDMNKEEMVTKRFCSKKNNKWYTQYRIENPDPAGDVNTIKKIAMKRALLMATIAATRSSGLFNQDLEDIAQNEESGTGKSKHSDQKPDPVKSAKPANAVPAPEWSEKPPVASEEGGELDKCPDCFNIGVATEQSERYKAKVSYCPDLKECGWKYKWPKEKAADLNVKED